MEIKKSASADLENKRLKIFLLAVACITLLFLAILNIRIGGSESDVDSALFEEIMQDLESLPEEDKRLEVPLYEKEKKEASERLFEVEQLEAAATDIDNDISSLLENEIDETINDDSLDDPITPVVVDEKDKILSWRIVEELPEFPGGLLEFMKWLTDNIKYPEQARRQRVEGTVGLQFIVNSDGSVSDIKIVEPADSRLNDEAMRVLSNMPQWKAGTYKDKPCRTLISIPIVFKI